MTVLPPTRISATFEYAGHGSLIDAAWCALEREARKLGKKVIGISLIHRDTICTAEGDVA